MRRKRKGEGGVSRNPSLQGAYHPPQPWPIVDSQVGLTNQNETIEKGEEEKETEQKERDPGRPLEGIIQLHFLWDIFV